MIESMSQEVFWDNESSRIDYCNKQIDGLKQLSVLKMIDAALRRAPIQPTRILEIGGGSQFISRHLCQIFPEAEIVCTDISRVRIEAFNNYYGGAPHNLRILGGVDARSLPFDDGCKGKCWSIKGTKGGIAWQKQKKAQVMAHRADNPGRHNRTGG